MPANQRMTRFIAIRSGNLRAASVPNTPKQADGARRPRIGGGVPIAVASETKVSSMYNLTRG